VSEALGWGALAASSLVVGSLLAFARAWPTVQLGAVLAFGAGALISAVSFELTEEGVKVAGLGWVAIGLGAGAMTYFTLDRSIERRFGTGGTALAVGAFLDGIPEQLVLGIGIAAGEGVSVGLLVAIFVSNLPEAIGSANAMSGAGRERVWIVRLWAGVAAVCVLATIAGYALADAASGELTAVIDGFAAGALLVMLIDSMIPDAAKDAGRPAGLVTTLGFAVAIALSSVS
jgi:zinc transporter, ZIP family